MSRKPSPGPASQIKIASVAEKPASGGPITSERIALDLAAFRASGGRIEVLGTTRVLTPSELAAQPKAPAPSMKSAPRKPKAAATSA
jgi:hypothetical protein